jgi:hypothetical protein
MPRIVKCLTLILLVAVPSAFSQQRDTHNGKVFSYSTGADLQEKCLHYDTTERFSGAERDVIQYDIGYCAGFVAAAIASIDPSLWQAPNGHLPIKQAVAVVKKYLADHPEKWAVTSPSFCTSSSERVYITAMGCEIEFGGARELQAAGAGGL